MHASEYNSQHFVTQNIPILDFMLPTVPTLTSICEDALMSAKIEKHDLKPMNCQLINEEYINKTSSNGDQNFDTSALYCPTANLKNLFRISHLNVSHPSRASLWFYLLRQDQARSRNKFQQAVERYPEDVR